MTALNNEYQSMAANAIAHAATMAGAAWQDAAGYYSHPHVIYKPKLFVDGDQWCALFGANLQDGVAGFGASPALAMWDFDNQWYAKLPAIQGAKT